MKSGFSFKGRHSSEFGVTLKTKSRPILPGVKSYAYEAPLMDGSYDFTAVNPYKREFYSDRIIELSMQIAADCLEELERKNAKIAAWLTGKGELVFDSANGVKWNGRFVSETAYAPERRGKTAVVSVIFRAEPIGNAVFGVSEGISLGNAISLDSNIPLDMSGYFEKGLSSGENEFEFVNMGDFYVRPIFKIIGDTKIITVKHGDNKIMLEDLNGGAIIDFEKCNIKDLDGNSILNKMQGDFFEFPPGVSAFTIYTETTGTLKIDYVPKTIYDFDFSELDWGDGNA